MKSQGAATKHIFVQFVANAMLINLVAVAVSGIIMTIASVYVSSIFPIYQINLLWASPLIWLLLSGALIIGIIVTGIIPGITLPSFGSGFNVRGHKQVSQKHLMLRKILVVSQYSMAIVLIIAAIAIKKQVQFMMDQDIGADINDVLVFKTPTNTANYQQKVASFRDELKRLNGIEEVAMSSVVPGQQVGYMGSHKRSDAMKGDDRLFEMLRVDPHFIPLYQLKLKEGRNFRENSQGDYDGVIINEEAAIWFGFANSADAVGKTVNLEGEGNKPYTIFGILDNYHQQSLKMNYKPVVFIMGAELYWIPMKYFSVRSFTSDKKLLIGQTQELFKKYFPEASFEYFFTDQYFNKQYVSDNRFSRLFMIFSWVSILIVMHWIIRIVRVHNDSAHQRDRCPQG
jgi:putative ABC transport system permease protein